MRWPAGGIAAGPDACVLAYARIPPSSDCDVRRSRNLPELLAHTEAHGESLPSSVTGELRAFVTCGDFEHGFLLERFAVQNA